MKIFKSFFISILLIFFSINTANSSNIKKEFVIDKIKYIIQMPGPTVSKQNLEDFEQINFGRNESDIKQFYEFYKQFTPCLIQISNQSDEEYNFESDLILKQSKLFGHEIALRWKNKPQSVLQNFSSATNSMLWFSVHILIFGFLADRFLDIRSAVYPWDIFISFFSSIGLVTFGSMLQLIRFFIDNPTVLNQYSEALIENGILIKTNNFYSQTNITQMGQINNNNTIPKESSLFILRFIENDKIQNFENMFVEQVN